MNKNHQENGALTGPLIFTLPASGFVAILARERLCIVIEGVFSQPPRRAPRSVSTRSSAREPAHLGITVNTVAPGFVPVERHADVGDEVRSAYISGTTRNRAL